MKTVYINGRYLTQKQTGVQRNAHQLTKNASIYFPEIIVLVPKQEINTSYDLEGLNLVKIGYNKGIIWEQLDLPLFLSSKGKDLLVNLTNTAPVTYSNQIVSIMDMSTFINPSWFSKSFAYYYKFLIPKIAKKAKIILTISKSSKNDIFKYLNVSKEKVKVIYCSVSSQFKTNKVDSAASSQILGKISIEKGGFFLAVSSLDPRKNFNSLIEAYLNFKNPQIKLVIVGSKNSLFGESKLLEESLSENIIFTGYLSDDELVVLYQFALCFIYPSLYEGFGIPPLEAMACSCPVIVSNTSSLPEVCGSAAIYINPYDINSITNAMNEVSENEELRNSLITEGKKQLMKFSWQESGRTLVEEINKLL
jgi:glycosyltransferase involved in cell wall biosynthesis